MLKEQRYSRSNGVRTKMKTKIKTIHSLSRKEKKKNKRLSNKIIRTDKIIRREVELGIGYDE